MTRILVDPRIAFGRPYVEGSGVMTATIYDRLMAKELPLRIANDYDLKGPAVWAALDFEVWRRRRGRYDAPYAEKLARGGIGGHQPDPHDGSWPRVVWPRKGPA